MKLIIPFLFLPLVSLTSSLLVNVAYGFEENLIIIQKVSSSRESFVISKGIKDNIEVGQESLFSTKDLSFAARCITVIRNYSQWAPLKKDIIVPFKKEDYVLFNPSVKTIYSQIPELKKRLDTLIFSPDSYWVFKSSFSQTISETLSGADEDTNASRRGFQLEINYQKDMTFQFFYEFGIRYDKETSLLSDPTIEIPSTRLLATTTAFYELFKLNEENSRAYIGAGLGIGTSATIVSEDVATGSSFLLPIVKMGIETKSNGKIIYILEMAFESITTKETFLEGQIQTTNLTNLKGSFGIKF